jgi:hypothetical protein
MFTLFAMKEANKNRRLWQAQTVEKILQQYFLGRPSIEATFSGYKLDLLLSPNWPWDDVHGEDMLYHHFCLVNSAEWTARAAPQLPFFYHNLDFDLVASLALPSQNYLILRPAPTNVDPRGYQLIEISQADARQQKDKSGNVTGPKKPINFGVSPAAMTSIY